jgi:hypothetical protein
MDLTGLTDYNLFQPVFNLFYTMLGYVFVLCIGVDLTGQMGLIPSQTKGRNQYFLW